MACCSPSLGARIWDGTTQIRPTGTCGVGDWYLVGWRPEDFEMYWVLRTSNGRGSFCGWVNKVDLFEGGVEEEGF